MPHYTPETIPDDPYRVAPPYCAQGEIEPPDVPVVSDKEAVERVLNALKTGAEEAFGETADEWGELLLDHIADRANNRLAEMSPDELEREGFLL